MQKGTKTMQGTSSVVSALVVGAAASVAVTLIGTAICAALISAETINAGSLGYCAIGILLLSSFIGAAAAAGKRKEKRLYTSLIAGAIYMIVLLCVTALFFGGRYEGVAVTALVIFSGSILNTLLGQSRKNTPKSRRSKIRRR